MNRVIWRSEEPGLGPLHTEFDNKGQCLHFHVRVFRSGEMESQKPRKSSTGLPTYYSVGHLTVAGGDTKTPNGKYLVAYNKITKDRFSANRTGVIDKAHSCTISAADKMQLILDYSNDRRTTLCTDRSCRLNQNNSR
jgi:nitrous-oxide reductase